MNNNYFSMPTPYIATIFFGFYIIGRFDALESYGIGENISNSPPKRFLANFFSKLNSRKSEKCTRDDVDSMTNVFHYKSLKNKKEKDVHEKIEGFKEGANGQIHIGYIGAKERCVAIKLLDIGHPEKKMVFKNAYKVLEKVQKKLAPKERKHVIELIDYGSTVIKRQNDGDEEEEFENDEIAYSEESNDGMELGILIMELGTETFGNKIYRERQNFLNDEEFAEIIREIVMPLRELHQVAMHLDYKPDNLVYVENWGKTLKVVDFDGTYLLPEAECKKQNAKRANFVAENLKILTGTDRYNPPEFYVEPQNLQLSTKADIWAVGMMLYEVLFLQDKYGIYEQMENDEKIFHIFLYHINEMHRGFIYKKEQIKYEKEQIKYAGEWLDLERNVNFLGWILRIWTDFPRTGILITNLLNVLPEMRMSAKGILDFLDGKCCPAELYGEKLEFMHIFDELSATELAKNIWDKMEEENGGKMEKWDKLEQLEDQMELAREKRWEEIEKLRRNSREKCDTIRTGK